MISVLQQSRWNGLNLIAMEVQTSPDTSLRRKTGKTCSAWLRLILKDSALFNINVNMCQTLLLVVECILQWWKTPHSFDTLQWMYCFNYISLVHRLMFIMHLISIILLLLFNHSQSCCNNLPAYAVADHLPSTLYIVNINYQDVN